MLAMSVTDETSQNPIGPCGPLEQSKSDVFRHSAMAALSSLFDLGAQAVEVGYYYRDYTDVPDLG